MMRLPTGQRKRSEHLPTGSTQRAPRRGPAARRRPTIVCLFPRVLRCFCCESAANQLLGWGVHQDAPAGAFLKMRTIFVAVKSYVFLKRARTCLLEGRQMRRDAFAQLPYTGIWRFWWARP